MDNITPNDPRLQWKTTQLNGKSYEYILAEPQNDIIDTVFLIHGWPDLAYGWRNQISFLLPLGYRVVAPNMMGYGKTDAPESLVFYTIKRACDDLAVLASQLGLTSFVIGGHDWGGALVYRFALRYPKMVSKAFVICTPFLPPMNEFSPISDLPNFKYQQQLAGPEVEATITGNQKIKQFLSGMFGGKTPTGDPIFSPFQGIFLDRLEMIGSPRLLSETDLNFYVKSYAYNGLRGTLNWYRTAKLNFDEERDIAVKITDTPLFEMPFLFIACSNDVTLSPALSEGMDVWFENLSRAEVASGHWAMVEKERDVNKNIHEFLSRTV